MNELLKKSTFQIAQSLKVNKGISVGMTQLHALARFGMIGKVRQFAKNKSHY